MRSRDYRFLIQTVPSIRAWPLVLLMFACSDDVTGPTTGGDAIGALGGTVVAPVSGTSLTVPPGAINGVSLSVTLTDTTLSVGQYTPLSQSSHRLVMQIAGPGVEFNPGRLLKLTVPLIRPPAEGAVVYLRVRFPATSEVYWAETVFQQDGRVTLDLPTDGLAEIGAILSTNSLDIVFETREVFPPPTAAASSVATLGHATSSARACEQLPSEAPVGPYAPCGTTLLYQLPGAEGHGDNAIVLVHGWLSEVATWDDYYRVQGVPGFADEEPAPPRLPGQVYFADLIPQLASDFPGAALYVFDYESFRDYHDTGGELAERLAELQELRGYSRIALVGHSMGGLVARVAAQAPTTPAIPLAGIATLGTPHLGTPLPDLRLGQVFSGGVRTSGGQSLAFSLQQTSRERDIPLFLLAGDISDRVLPSPYRTTSQVLCSRDQSHCRNDGVVPVSSALPSSFFSALVPQRSALTNYDHTDLKTGRQALGTDPMYLSLRADLLSLFPSTASLTVTANVSSSWTIEPGGLTGSGVSGTYSVLPTEAGTVYTIVAGELAGYQVSVSSSTGTGSAQMVFSGQSKSFTLAYAPTGPDMIDPALDAIALANGFDFPFGAGDCTEHASADYRVSADFLDATYSDRILHSGEDWNRGGGDDDSGDPVCAIGAGVVVAAGSFTRASNSWGNVVIVKHHLPGGVSRWSSYAHLGTMLVSPGATVTRGQQLGTIGRQPSSSVCNPATGDYCSHLHLEVRNTLVDPDKTWSLAEHAAVATQYADPSDQDDDLPFTARGFIESHRYSSLASIAAGSSHSCGLTNAAAALCWGWNASGELGDGTTSHRNEPTAVSGGLIFAGVHVGGSHSCGLTAQGMAYCWGYNLHGSLGDGTVESRPVPVPVAGGTSYASLTAGSFHTCGLTSVGAAYCWGHRGGGQVGDGGIGELGHGYTEDRLSPTPVLGGHVFKQLSAGDQATCGVTTNGTALCWGRIWNGFQLCCGAIPLIYSTPRPIMEGRTFESVTAGASFVCGLTSEGAAYCQGVNGFGQLGDGTTSPSVSETLVSGGLTLTRIAAGHSHACGIASAGEVYCWGSNSEGQLGDGTVAAHSVPQVVGGEYSFATLSLRGSTSCGMTTSGEALCWGARMNIHDGGSTIRVLTPTPVPSP